MVIDKETTAQTDISLSIDFPLYCVSDTWSYHSIPCGFLQVGYRDALGNDRMDIENEIYKTSLDVNGNLIGARNKSSVIVLHTLHSRSQSRYRRRRRCWKQPSTRTIPLWWRTRKRVAATASAREGKASVATAARTSSTRTSTSTGMWIAFSRRRLKSVSYLA